MIDSRFRGNDRKGLLKKTFLISILLVFSLLSQDIKAEEIQDKYAEIENLDELVTTYHETVNTLFNEKIKLIKENTGNNTQVGSDQECRDDKNNVTTYCLAVIATDEFNAFQDELLNRKDTIDLGYGQEQQTMDFSIEGVISQVTEQSDFLNSSLNEAKKTLDLALETYNQFRVAYPLHLQYLDLIDLLEEYNNEMAQIKAYSEILPGKFIDATTTDCT